MIVFKIVDPVIRDLEFFIDYRLVFFNKINTFNHTVMLFDLLFKFALP